MSLDDSPAAAIRSYIDAFNRGDADAMAACFASEGVILDGMPPHLWRGPSAARDWYRDVRAEGKDHGASGYRVTLGEPSHADVSSGRAYLVVPAEMRFSLQGRPVTQTGATLTFALSDEGGKWRIAAWAWSKGTAR